MCIRDSYIALPVVAQVGQVVPEEEQQHRLLLRGVEPVSYTHLDVYKRQEFWRRLAAGGVPGLCSLCGDFAALEFEPRSADVVTLLEAVSYTHLDVYKRQGVG